MNIWPAKPAELLIRNFPIGPPTRRRLAVLILTLLYLPSQCSYKFGLIFLHSLNIFQRWPFIFPRIFLVA